jgi:multicomponent Na+:H+ antiporter subunit F
MMTIFFLLTAAAALVALVRMVLGPGHADRIIALDILFAVAVAWCISAALSSGRLLFLDIALVLSLIGFVATVAWARLIDHADSPDSV